MVIKLFRDVCADVLHVESADIGETELVDFLDRFEEGIVFERVSRDPEVPIEVFLRFDSRCQLGARRGRSFQVSNGKLNRIECLLEYRGIPIQVVVVAE